MKCVHCLEEINEGASVCRVCGRKQPLTLEARRQRNNLIAIVAYALLAAGGVGYYLYDAYAEDSAIEIALACYDQHGLKNATFDAVKNELARSNASNFRGWRHNLDSMNIVVGCASQNFDWFE